MDDAFDAYKRNPTSDLLIRLLRAHQDRVYRLCLHVLRRPADAEDAAQEALIRIAGSARRLDNADAFRRWVYRVSLNAALEAARKAARRRAHESRVPMQEPRSQPLDEESRRELFEGLAALDDDARGLLLDHHVEGETLEAIGEREGVSPQAVSKRLERACEELRRRLPASLASLALLSPDRASMPPTPDLVTGPVLAKVSALAGGTIVASKVTATTVIVLTAVLCLGVGAWVGAWWVGPASTPEETSTDAPRIIVRKPQVPAVRPSRPAAEPRSGPINASPAMPKDLSGRLARFRGWVSAWHEERDRLHPSFVGNQQAQIDYANRKREELLLELAGLRDLIDREPGAFFRFLKDPDNAFCISVLAEYGFGYYRMDEDGFRGGQKLASSSLPSAITEGFLELLRSGSPILKDAALVFFGNVADPPQEFGPLWSGLVLDPDPKVAHRAIQLAHFQQSIPPDTFKAILAAGRASPDTEVRRAAATAMGFVNRPEAEAFLLERIETVTDSYELISSVVAMSGKFYASSRSDAKVDEPRFLKAVADAMTRGLDGPSLKVVVGIVLFVPPDRCRSVLERARSVAPDDESRDAIGRVLRKVDEGMTEQRELSALLWPPSK